MLSDPLYHGSDILTPAQPAGGRLQELRAQVARRIRDALQKALAEGAPESSPEEIESHFGSMPQRYWLRVDAEACRWHLATLHAFFLQMSRAQATTTSPIVQWRPLVNSGLTEVAVCSWDRPALLMNIAGALTRAGFDILRADAYTRADHIALDIFEVREIDAAPGLHDTRLRYAARLLAAAMASARSVSEASAGDDGATVPETPLDGVEVENDSSAADTLVRIDAPDRVGLLFRMLEALANSGASVEQATVVTIRGRARDTFRVTDGSGQKIDDPAKVDALRQRLLAAITAATDFKPSGWGADPLGLVEQDEVGTP
jgi:[protein-PII] uridylyltransferase